jgi:hypothetical protein
MIYSGHEGYLDDIAETVRKADDCLRRHKSRFDFLAVTGMSGVLVGSPLAIRLHRPLVVLRKEHDACHSLSGDLINRREAFGRYLIIDDFISSGTTYRRLREFFDVEDTGLAARTRYAGVYLYSGQTLSWDDDGIVTYKPELSQGVYVDAYAKVEDYSFAASPTPVIDEAVCFPNLDEAAALTGEPGPVSLALSEAARYLDLRTQAAPYPLIKDVLTA